MLQHVLHDFSSDDACRRILKNIVPAMTTGYSKLLIKELMIPDRNAPWALTAMDVNVVTFRTGAHGGAIQEPFGVGGVDD
jgi:hypothetical protein